MTKIGLAIRVERTRSQLSQEELAGKLDVSTNTVTRWERGETQPRYSDLVALSQIFSRQFHEWVPSGEKEVVIDGTSQDASD